MIPDPGAGDTERDARLEAAYRAGAQQQPPERLDDAIRAAARRAVAAGPRRSADRLRRWSIPLSLAAVVLLSVTLVTMMREEGAERWVNDASPLPRDQPPAAIEAPATVPAPVTATVPAQSAAQSRTPTPPPARMAAAPVVVIPAEPPQSVTRAEPLVAEQRGPQRRERLAADVGSRAKATAGAAASAEADATVSQDNAARDAAAPRPLLGSAPASAPAAMAETAAGAGKPEAAGPQGLGIASSAKARRAQVPETLWQDLEGEPVAKWLDRLRELRNAGRTADADRLVAEIRRRFPDVALPDDLR